MEFHFEGDSCENRSNLLDQNDVCLLITYISIRNSQNQQN